MTQLKKLCRPETCIFLAIWLALLFVGRSQLFRDPGTFWHTVVGEQMLAKGELIYTDTFSFTANGKHWVAHQWLGECTMAVLYRLSGFDGLLFAAATALAVLYTWLAVRFLRAGMHWVLALLFLGLTMVASSYHFHIRPHLVTIMLLGVSFGWLCDYEAGRKNLKKLIWLVPLLWLWANFHGGALAGLATIILTIGGWFGAKLLRLPTPVQSWRELAFWAILIPVCGLTFFVNPYGWQMPQAWFAIMGADLPSIIEEHAPLNPAKIDGFFVLAFGIFYGVMLLGVFPKRPKVTWLIPLLWFYLACTRIRHGPLFAITAGVALADLFPHTIWAAWLQKKGSDLFMPLANPQARLRVALASLPFMLTIVFIYFIVLSVRLPPETWATTWERNQWAVELDKTLWPVDLRLRCFCYCDKPRIGGWKYYPRNGRIFNEDVFGGYIIMHYPEWKVFIDDRCELYGMDFLSAYAHALREDPSQLEKWAAEYDLELALVRPTSKFNEYLSKAPNWKLAVETQAANLYERQANTAKR